MASLIVFVLLSVLTLSPLAITRGSASDLDHTHRHYHHSHQHEKAEKKIEKDDRTHFSHDDEMAKTPDNQRLDYSDDDGDETNDADEALLPKYVGDDVDMETTVDAPEGWVTPAGFPAMSTAAVDDIGDILNTRDAQDLGQDDETHHRDSSESAPVDDDLTTPASPEFPSDMLDDEGFAEADDKRRKLSDGQNKLANRPRWQISKHNQEDVDQAKSQDKQTGLDNTNPDGTGGSVTSAERSKNRPNWKEETRTDASAKDPLEELEEFKAGADKTDGTQHAEKTTGSAWQEWKRIQKAQAFGKSCPGCEKLQAGVTKAKELRQMVLRDQLIDKLRLVQVFKQRPWPPKLPDAVFPDAMQHDQPHYDDHYYAKPTELIIFGRDLPRRYRLRRAGTGSYQFGVTRKVQGRVTSAELWVYKMSDANDVHGQTLVITELHFSKRKRLRERSMVMRTDTHVQEGWMRFDVTRLVQRWVKNKTPESLQMLAIRCKTCHRTSYRAIFGAKSNFRPVLVVHEQSARAVVRERRASQCDPSVTCCRFDLQLNFRDLGIHEIFYPRTIKADYCYGTCDRPDAAHHNHTVLIQRHRFASFSHVNDTMRERLQPCCVPVVLREASIMHYLNDGLDTQVSTVPNLLVDKCGCA